MRLRGTGRLSSHRKLLYFRRVRPFAHTTMVGLRGVVLQRTRMWPGDPRFLRYSRCPPLGGVLHHQAAE